MNKKAHMVGGACAGILMSTALIKAPINSDGLVLSSILVGASIWGSLLPDIDHPESTFGKKIPFLSKLISETGGHRGITHAPIIYFLLANLFLLFKSKIIQLIVVVGLEYFLSYLIIRFLNKLGIIRRNKVKQYILFLIFIVLTLISGEKLNLIYSQMILGIFIGSISHIFLDSLTKSGTPWLYPFSNRRFRLLKLRTGKDDYIGIILSVFITVVSVYFMRFK